MKVAGARQLCSPPIRSKQRAERWRSAPSFPGGDLKIDLLNKLSA
jgi:hypothetical protein